MSAGSRLLFLVAALLVAQLAPVTSGASTGVSSRSRESSTNTSLAEESISALTMNKLKITSENLGEEICSTVGDLTYYCLDGYYCCIDGEHCCFGSSAATLIAPFFAVVAALALATFQLQ